jgi:hypothetical protein
VDDALQLLRDAGLPLAMPRRMVSLAPAVIAGAVRRVIAEAPTGRVRDALAAYIGAWADHWPETFARVLDDEVSTWARLVANDDRDRYLKLRRIALENLATVL